MCCNSKETFSPVVSEAIVRVFLAVILIFRMLGGISDAKSIFSYSELETDEEMHA